jgi:methionine biosynthesis protein MetW
VRCRGIEAKQSRVNACVTRGLSVLHGDADHDLVHYPTGSFDYVILSRTLQATHRPREALLEITRIGKCALVSFPNFGYWRVRWDLLWRGRMPMTETLGDTWYETQNIHFCTIADFVDLCRVLDISIDRALAVDHQGAIKFEGNPGRRANLLGEVGVFMICRS